MIVDTMTYAEVGDKLVSFARSNRDRAVALLQHYNNKYKRVMLAGGDRRVDFKPISFESENIEVFIFPYSFGKRDFKKYGIAFAFVLRFYYRGQFWYAKINNSYNMAEIYQNHFFERYIERHLHSDDRVGVDIVRDYFIKTNLVTYPKRIDSDTYPNCVYGTTQIGMSLGSDCGKVLVWKTYIDKDTIEYGKKKEVFDNSSNKVIPIGVDSLGLNIYPMF